MMAGNKLVLFDIDGTLMRTRGVSKRLFCQGLSEIYKREISWDGYTYQGQPDRRVALDLLARHGIKGDDARAHLTAAFEQIGELWRHHPAGEDIIVFPGVKELAGHLAAESGLFMGQLTANIRSAARGKLAAARIDHELFPTGGYGEDADERNELLPVAVNRSQTLFQTRFSVEQTVVIGDSPADIACARHSGAQVIAVGTGYTPIDELASHQPDLLIADMASGRDQILHFLGR